MTTTLASRAELGFSADDVLASMGGIRNEALVWHVHEDLGYGPEAGEQALTVELRATTPQAQVVDFEPHGAQQSAKLPMATPASSAARACKDELQLEVELTLKSAGGALDERFAATLRAQAKDSARLFQRVDARELGGSFEITRFHLPDHELSQLSFSLSLTSLGLAGEVLPTLSGVPGSKFEEVGVDYVMPIASFGPAPCGPGGLTVPLDKVVQAFSAADTLARMAAHSALSARAEQGPRTALTLSFAPADRACAFVLPGQSEQGSGRKPDSIEVAGVVIIESSDATLDGSWPSTLLGEPGADGALESLTLIGGGPANASLLDEASSLYDGAALRLEAKLSSEGMWSGALQLHGLQEPASCAEHIDEDAASSAPCPGTVAEPVSRMSLESSERAVELP